jgi:hypothetical protein
MSNRQKKNQKKQNMNNILALSHPKPIQMTLKGLQTLRFNTHNLAPGLANFNASSLFNSLLMAATATSGYLLFQSIKIKYIEVWSVTTSTSSVSFGAASTVSVAYTLSGNSGDTPVFTKSDTTLGTAELAHVKFAPPKGSAAALWQSYEAVPFFSIAAPNDSIIDVCFEYVLQAGATNQAAAAALVAATPGVIYGRGLDGAAVGGTSYPMVPGTYLLV